MTFMWRAGTEFRRVVPSIGSRKLSGRRRNGGPLAAKFGCYGSRLVASLVLLGLMAGSANPQQLPMADADIAAELNFQRRLVAEDMIARKRRLDGIVFRVMRGAVNRCGDATTPFHGLSVATDHSFSTEIRAQARAAFGLDNRLHVLFITPGSPAAVADIENRDVIARTNGRDVTPGPAAVGEWASLIDRAGGNPIRLVIGGTRPRVVIVRPVNICDYPVEIRHDREPVAFTQSKEITVTKGMMDFSSDGELAFILSHELAHNLLGHAVRSKEAEIEADYVGLQILAEAGYQIDRIAGFWRRVAVAFPAWIANGGTHPSTPRRFVLLRRAAEEMQLKRAAVESTRWQALLREQAENLAAKVPGPRGEPTEHQVTPNMDRLPVQDSATYLSTAEIEEIEELLAYLKFDPGPIDGVIDDDTRIATHHYQVFAGLPIDGQPSETTLVDLRAVVLLIGGGSE